MPGEKRRYRKAGHRCWAAGGTPVPGKHRGDIMSPETRSKVMSRIQGKNTSPERIIFAELRQHGLCFSKHVNDMPGRPDIIFREANLAVFIDGSFWHGWRFPLWQHKLSIKWRNKIAATRERDQRNFAKLRRMGWAIIRIWEHQIENNLQLCINKILNKLDQQIEELNVKKVIPKS
jgi:DNA mismatch endonuclease (patch repair protein)